MWSPGYLLMIMCIKTTWGTLAEEMRCASRWHNPASHRMTSHTGSTPVCPQGQYDMIKTKNMIENKMWHASFLKFVKALARGNFSWNHTYLGETILQMPNNRERNQNSTKSSNTYSRSLFLWKKNQTLPLTQLASKCLVAKQAQNNACGPNSLLAKYSLLPYQQSWARTSHFTRHAWA